MNTNLLFALVELGLSGYFFYRIIFKKESTASLGIAAGAFLVIAIFHLAPFLATWIGKWLS